MTEKNSIIIGVDPGLNGAIVVMDTKASKLYKHVIPRIGIKGPLDFIRLSEIFEEQKDKNAIVVIEEVHAMHNSAANITFSFGGVCYAIEMAAVAHKLKYIKVTPKTWQKAMHEGIPLIKVLKKGNKKQTIDRKAMSLVFQKRFFSNVECRMPNKTGGLYKNSHGGIVDALIICEYGRRFIV